MNILIAVPDNDARRLFFSESLIVELEKKGNISWNNKKTQFTVQELTEKLRDNDICITGWGNPKISQDMINSTGVKLIAHLGGTVKDFLPEEAFLNTDVKVITANDAFGRSVAECVLMMLLMSFRRAYDDIARLKDKSHPGWQGSSCVHELYKKRIGILGYGSIARELVKLLKPFEVEIFVCSKHCTNEEADEHGFILADFERVVSESDAISLHSTLTDRTYHMLSKEALLKMKDDAIIVNTARGAIIDEKELIEELAKGRLFAALEVFETEPLPQDSPLRILPNVLPLPHNGGFTYECREMMGRIIVEDIIRFIDGKPLMNMLTESKYKAMTDHSIKRMG